MRENTNHAARELSRRRSGSDEILLLWHPDSQQVELAVRDVETGVGSSLEVAPSSANDAFNHPYAYLAGHDTLDRVIRVEEAIVDG